MGKVFKCPVCNELLLEMTPTHARKHGMTRGEILDAYPELKQNIFGYGKRRPTNESSNETFPNAGK
jgi:hypothetical protein